MCAPAPGRKASCPGSSPRIKEPARETPAHAVAWSPEACLCPCHDSSRVLPDRDSAQTFVGDACSLCVACELPFAARRFARMSQHHACWMHWQLKTLQQISSLRLRCCNHVFDCCVVLFVFARCHLVAAETSPLCKASLCVNELSKSAKEVSPQKWDALAERFAPSLEKLSARNLTLLLNAFSHARAAKESWISDTAAALHKVPNNGYSAQDLCLLLSSMVRLSWTESALVTRLLAEECPSRVVDLQARGIAGFAHAVSRLGQDAKVRAHAEELTRALFPRIRRFLAEDALRPLEIALTTDALSRFGDEAEPLVHGEPQLPRWADEATSELEPSLVIAVPLLKPLELVMVVSALSRRGYVSSAPLAEALSAAIARDFEKWPLEELCIVVHSAARLDLRGLVEGSTAPIMSILRHVGSNAGNQLLQDCSPNHAVLLLHGLAKLLVPPPTILWVALLDGIAMGRSITRASAIRLSLAAAKSDFTHDSVRCILEHATSSGPLAALSDDALAAMIYTSMHPFYFRRRILRDLLLHVASCRHVLTQSFGLQARLGLVELLLCNGPVNFSLFESRLLLKLAGKTDERTEWSQKLPSRPSALQADVHFELNSILGGRGPRVDSEVFAWPFCIDLCWLQGKMDMDVLLCSTSLPLLVP